MRTKVLLAAMAAATLAAGSASAAVVLFDNFDADTLQLNWPGDALFTSSGPAIQGQASTDLIGNPNFFDLQPGHGRYVDLDGSTGNGNDPAGVLTSVATFGPGTYTLSFLLAGNLRGAAAQTTTVSLGGFTTTLAPANNDPFGSHSFTFTTATGGHLVFTENGPSDQQGNLLDDVRLASAPEPETWALMLLGFGGLGGLLRSRRRRAALA